MKKKFLNFLIVIFVFLTMIGINESHSLISRVNAVEAPINLVTANPTGKTLYVMDPNGVLHTDYDKEEGSLIAQVRIRFGGTVNIVLTDNGSNVYTGSFEQVNPPLGGVLGMWLKISYTYPDGRVETTNEVSISSSINEAIKGDYNNQDALVSIGRNQSDNLVITSDTDIFNGLNYLFYAYQAEPGDVVYCEYSNGGSQGGVGDGNSYDIPMVLTSYRYGDLPVYRACIYSYPDHYYIRNLKFKVIKHTGVEDLTQRVVPITKNTGYSTWHAKVYFKTEPVVEHSNNWHEFYQAGNPYNANFYYGSSDNLQWGSLYASRSTGKADNYIIEVPPEPTMSGYTFIGWEDVSTGKIVDLSYGDKIFLSKNIDYIAVWKEGSCIFLYVDPGFIKKIHGTSDVLSIQMDLSRQENMSSYKTFNMEYMDNTRVYRLVISLTGENKDINQIKSCRLVYKIGRTTYQTNIMITPLINSNNMSHKDYHIIVPETLSLSSKVASGYIFDRLYTLTYHYGDNWSLIYNRLPVSIGLVRPLFMEKESHTLEGWYERLNSKQNAVDPDSRFEHRFLNSNTDLYANYVSNRDYYFYVDNYQNQVWKPNQITMYNDYFLDHEEKIAIPSNQVKDLGHNIYQVRLDISKSYDQFYVSGLPLSGGGTATSSYQTESKPLLTEYTYFDITPETRTENHKKLNIVNTELYKDCKVGAQKLPYDEVNKKNAFRFTIGVPKEIDDYYQNPNDPTKPQDGSQTNLGFKIIFIQDTSCYIGFWNFEDLHKLDRVRLDMLYEKDKEYDGHIYNGFYSLTIRDDISFKYSNYNHIIIIGVYKDTNNELKVVKATEYSIVTREKGNVDIYYQANHIVES